MRPAINIENISKIYTRRSHRHKLYGIIDLLKEIFGRGRTSRLRKDEFYAVKNFSLTVYPGETVALIGRNGCGKSTTLRMIAGLIKSDAGFIQTEGRLQALIALGAGFNQNLSGTDNIRLAAATVGFTRKETSSLLKDIEKFADIGEFISSPVKNYSSGMYARLGFAVAIHMKPEILIIDEILGVGDYAFQNKCFVKMEELRKAGTTILLVSHSHTKVIQLCKKAVWIDGGIKRMEGPSDEVVKEYLEYLADQETEVASGTTESKVSELKKPENEIYGPVYDSSKALSNLMVRLLKNGEESQQYTVHDTLVLEASFELVYEVRDLNVTFNFVTVGGKHISAVSTLNTNPFPVKTVGRVDLKLHIEDLVLAPGDYVVTMPIHEGQAYLYRNVVARFTVRQGNRLIWGNIEFPHSIEARLS